jgi:hypothetical protein
MQQKRLIGYDPERPMNQAQFEAYLIRQIEQYLDWPRQWLEDSWGYTFEIRLKKIPEAEWISLPDTNNSPRNWLDSSP